MCDLCGAKTKGGGWEGESNFSHPETRLECLTGDIYPEGDYRQYARLDVCPTCFETKIIPALESKFKVSFSRGDIDE